MRLENLALTGNLTPALYLAASRYTGYTIQAASTLSTNQMIIKV